MTSRERVVAAVEHREPDRVPVDLGATPSSGISAIAYGNLKQHLGMATGHTRIYDVVQQLAQPEECVLDQFGIDVVDVGRTFNTENADWYDVTLSDGQLATVSVMVPSGPQEMVHGLRRQMMVRILPTCRQRARFSIRVTSRGWTVIHPT